MNYMRRVLAVGFSAALLLAFGTQTAGAIQGESIVLSPASKRYDLDAGETKTDSITIINDGTEPYDFKVYASPYSVQDKTYTPNYSEKKANADLNTWVTFDTASGRLEPNERTKISYTVNVPDDAAPGGHYGVIFAETQPEPGKEDQIARKKRVGAVMFATVEGDYKLEGQEVQTVIHKLQLQDTLTATMTVENTGNTDFTMQRTFAVKDVFGKVQYEENKENIIFPKTTRVIDMEWSGGTRAGLYNVTTESKILGKTVTNSAWVVFMPLWAIFILIALVIAGVVLLVRRFRR